MNKNMYRCEYFISKFSFILLVTMWTGITTISASADDFCPADQFLLENKSCKVCTYPSNLIPSGIVVGIENAACYTCDSGGLSDLRSCELYWREATPASAFINPRQALRYQRQGKRWSSALSKGKTNTRHGILLLQKTYRGSLQNRFATQTDALNFLVNLIHFGVQLQPSKPWPALKTTATFSQLNILGDMGVNLIPNSHVGQMTLHPGALDAQMLEENGGAWINMVIKGSLFPFPALDLHVLDEFPLMEEDWRVRNLYTSFSSAAELVQSENSVIIGLGVVDGTPVEMVEFTLLQHQNPIPFVVVETEIQDPNAEMDFELVVPDDLQTGGIFGEGGTNFEAPDFGGLNEWDGCPGVEINPAGCLPLDPPVSLYGSLGISPYDVPEVNEFDNFCAPAAVARGLKILFPELPSPILIMIGLGNEMGTTTTDGTSLSNIKPGKDAYVASMGLSVTTTETEKADFSNTADVAAKLAAAVDAAIATLEAKGVVEMDITWLNAGSTRGNSGHLALVTSIMKKSDGSVEITYVDDPTQGDNNQENKFRVIHLDNLGKFDGNSGQVDGFFLETTP